MAEGAARETQRDEARQSGEGAPRRRARLFPVSRRTPVLQIAKGVDPNLGIYGLDLTAGCGHGCAYCHIRGSVRFPGEGKVLFDPNTNERLIEALNKLGKMPSRVVLSPNCDPLPPDRDVRAETLRIVRTLLERKVPVQIMTRGRIGRPMVELLARHSDLVRVAVGVFTMERGLSAALEPLAAWPEVRLRGLAQLVREGVPVEARVEPLIAGLTDTRENLAPLFERLASIGVTDVISHYLFLLPAMEGPVRQALARFGWSEKLTEDYDEGPAFAVGSIGTTRHLPVDVRRGGLARLLTWGAEFGLNVRTGQAQNPDLPKIETLSRPASATPLKARPISAPLLPEKGVLAPS